MDVHATADVALSQSDDTFEWECEFQLQFRTKILIGAFTVYRPTHLSNACREHYANMWKQIKKIVWVEQTVFPQKTCCKM